MINRPEWWTGNDVGVIIDNWHVPNRKGTSSDREYSSSSYDWHDDDDFAHRRFCAPPAPSVL